MMEISPGFVSTDSFQLYLHSHFELEANFPATRPPTLALNLYLREDPHSISIFQGVHHDRHRGEHVFLIPTLGCILQDRHIWEQELQRMLVQALPRDRPHYLNVQLLTFYLSSYSDLICRQFPTIYGGTMVMCAMIVPRFVARQLGPSFSGVAHGGSGVFGGIPASTRARVRGLKRIVFDEDEGTTSANSSKETLCHMLRRFQSSS
ncbi:hypothetical protein Cni_G10042 [Canna indica]|uniref:Uncharacterized protein n=1 Tax=Canna indica TaxID=4628 RepID=A0AAQ3Q6Z6_9LILI|nr:hypothetical protein Cni_G10042 [Canna indica]